MTAAALGRSRFPVGSSHRIRLGWFTSARAIATRWDSPPDSVVGRASSRCPSPTASSAPAAAPQPRAARGLVVELGEQHVLQRRAVGQQVERLEHHTDLPAAQRGPVPVVQCGGVQAVQQIAARRSECPAGPSRCSSVDLPDPDGPGHRHIITSLDQQIGQGRSPQHRRRARVGAGQAAQLDRRDGHPAAHHHTVTGRELPRGRPGWPGHSRSRRYPASPAPGSACRAHRHRDIARAGCGGHDRGDRHREHRTLGPPGLHGDQDVLPVQR